MDMSIGSARPGGVKDKGRFSAGTVDKDQDEILHSDRLSSKEMNAEIIAKLLLSIGKGLTFTYL
jgi:hypothetical protein